jgi:endonuclease/exonuclease/phosphatase family metal-dependent hydrolase
VAAGAVAPAVAAEPDKQPFTVIAYNVLKSTGFPTDKVRARGTGGQIVERMALELSLYRPDIVNFSESPDEDVVKQLAERLRMNYVRFPSGEDWPGTLLSRFEIVDARNAPVVTGQRPKDLFTRHWGRAVVKLPGGDVIVHSAHLYPGRSPAIRLREIPEMIKAMRSDLEAGRSMLLMGDLNHTPAPPEYPLWTEAGWIDTFAAVGRGDGFTIGVARPQHRIDYVFAAGPLAKAVVESRPLFEGAFRTNPDDATSFALSDHLPQLARFQLAPA